MGVRSALGEESAERNADGEVDGPVHLYPHVNAARYTWGGGRDPGAVDDAAESGRQIRWWIPSRNLAVGAAWVEVTLAQ